MKVCLLYPMDYDLSKITYYSTRKDIIKDFQLAKLAQIMARKDSYIENVMLRIMMAPVKEKEVLIYRHEVLKDCLEFRTEFNRIYEICTNCVNQVNQYIRDYHSKKSYVTVRSITEEIQTYQRMLEYMSEIQGILEYMQSSSRGIHHLRSQLLKEHFRYPIRELEQLKEEMNSLDGGAEHQMYLHVSLGNGFKIKDVYIEDILLDETKGLAQSLKKTAKSMVESILRRNALDMNDVNVLRHLEELREIGLEQVHKIYMIQIKNMIPFFEQLRTEIAFYIGADNYYHAYRLKGLPMCVPFFLSGEETQIGFEGLYEPVLGFHEKGEVVSNSSECKKITVTIISGANQGGKSTYLKSIGVAQVMMQSGIYVNATTFHSSLFVEIFTHFSRREDKTMTRSRFEEELMRLDIIFQHLTKNSLLLMNESFASTTEEEGSSIAKDLTKVLYEAEIPFYFVSHLYKYATQTYESHLPDVHFLNAERKPDGTRTFKMVEQPPNHTSYGMDLFDEIIGI